MKCEVKGSENESGVHKKICVEIGVDALHKCMLWLLLGCWLYIWIKYCGVE
jgi:hypothetical protein